MVWGEKGCVWVWSLGFFRKAEGPRKKRDMDSQFLRIKKQKRAGDAYTYTNTVSPFLDHGKHTHKSPLFFHRHKTLLTRLHR